MTKGRAKTPPEFLKNSVIYQINLRAFTPGGTLRGRRERLLPHIASLGADLVYLCPIFLADDDPRERLLERPAETLRAPGIRRICTE